MPEKTYIAIDLKSYYASVECVKRGLDPLVTNLVVADKSRTEKTICLAVSPALKSFGIPGRPRLFEVVQTIKRVNEQRQRKAPGKRLTKSSYDIRELQAHPEYAVDYLVAVPQMAHYMERSGQIYGIYLKHIAPEDIHVYSIDEVFIDATSYLKMYDVTPREFAKRLIQDVYSSTGITATAGIGTNLYLCKVAMDIVAKHVSPDEDGVRIAELDEMSYRRELWTHRPLKDFWRVGKGYARKLEEHGLYTMGDIARCSIGKESDYFNEDLLYKLFGVNAELLIDHAWGWEPCTIKDIKAYVPAAKSIGAGQVLQHPYHSESARFVVREMADSLSLDLVEKGLETNQIVLTIGYDIENLKDSKIRDKYKGPVTVDAYNRKVPKHAHGTRNLKGMTSSTKLITCAAVELFDEITDPKLLVRRINLCAEHVLPIGQSATEDSVEQLDLFSDYQESKEKEVQEEASRAKEQRIQEAVLHIKHKFGKNAVLKGTSLQEEATAQERNRQVGGHRA